MSSQPLIELSSVLRPRNESPMIEAVLRGELPIVSKVRFNDGGIELRVSPESRTDLILARRGDLLVSGINALKGAVGLHAKDSSTDIVATIHYSAYEIDECKALPAFIHEYLR